MIRFPSTEWFLALKSIDAVDLGDRRHFLLPKRPFESFGSVTSLWPIGSWVSICFP